jgi:hypothetical protein
MTIKIGVQLKIGGGTASFSFTPGEAPSGLAVAQNGSYLSVSWVRNSTMEDGFLVERSTDGVTYVSIAVVGAGITIYLDTSVASGTLYYYRVRAYRGAVYSNYSNVDSETALYAGEVIIRDGDTGAWYDWTDTASITQAGGNVSAWADKLLSGDDLAQGDPAKQPSYDAVNGIYCDGVAEFMKTAQIAAWVQPLTIYIVARMMSSGTYYYFFGGWATASAFWRVDSPNTDNYINAGSNINLSVTYPVDWGNWHIFRIQFNGANSWFIRDAGAKVSGNAGANTLEAFTMSARATGTLHIEAYWKEIVIRKVADSDADSDDVYDYLKKKYGL